MQRWVYSSLDFYALWVFWKSNTVISYENTLALELFSKHLLEVVGSHVSTYIQWLKTFFATKTCSWLRFRSSTCKIHSSKYLGFFFQPSMWTSALVPRKKSRAIIFIFVIINCIGETWKPSYNEAKSEVHSSHGVLRYKYDYFTNIY